MAPQIVTLSVCLLDRSTMQGLSLHSPCNTFTAIITKITKRNRTNMFLGSQKIDYHGNHCNIDPKEKKEFRKTLQSLERSVHLVVERELNYPKLRMEEEDCRTIWSGTLPKRVSTPVTTFTCAVQSEAFMLSGQWKPTQRQVSHYSSH